MKICNHTEKDKKIPSKKNKKLWCGGHAGRQHNPVCIKDPWWEKFVTKDKPNQHYILSCSSCGKNLDRYFGDSESPLRDKRIKPDWVTF